MNLLVIFAGGTVGGLFICYNNSWAWVITLGCALVVSVLAMVLDVRVSR